ncbi:MAG: hypothetical protein HGB10_12045 [Coriobacteriia bacterium]|nr:hypothetical protein [Coriobacteriia bacterium]
MTSTPGPVRIACVGDSITRGTFVWRRGTNSYPAQLQRMLGERYLVCGFGANGHAAQHDADMPYQGSDAFVRSGDFEPDIVLIMLGTNDVRGDNWKGADAFERDYRALVAHYRGLASRPRVWLLTPPTLYRLGRSANVRYGMSESALEQVCAVVEQIASDMGCGLVDVHGATAGHPEAFKFDGVHPGGAGATLIARAVREALAHATSEIWEA